MEARAAAGCAVTDRPILFSGPMVRAILAGTKTQTRRLLTDRLKRYPSATEHLDMLFRDDPKSRVRVAECGAVLVDTHGGIASGIASSPYGVPGVRLWVRETFATLTGNGHRTVYRADNDPPMTGPADCPVPVLDMKWTPSIFMRRAQSRLTLTVTDVRVERLQSITEEDARAEGIDWTLADALAIGRGGTDTAARRYAALWDSINADRAPWASNPWVWVVSFARVP